MTEKQKHLDLKKYRSFKSNISCSPEITNVILGIRIIDVLKEPFSRR